MLTVKPKGLVPQPKATPKVKPKKQVPFTTPPNPRNYPSWKNY